MTTLTERERDLAARTILGEAAGQSPEGQAAVAWTIRNRTQDARFPNSVADVILQPKQFSAWNKGAGGNGFVNVRSGPAYDEALRIVDSVWNDQIPDPTNGAIYYGNVPKAKAGWGDFLTSQGNVTKIGAHTFAGTINGGTLPDTNLEVGSRGSTVSALQQQLQSSGFSPGAIDSIYGPKTASAVKAFQTANGLTVDGIVGPQTRSAMQAKSAPSYASWLPPSTTEKSPVGAAFTSPITSSTSETPLSRINSAITRVNATLDAPVSRPVLTLDSNAAPSWASAPSALSKAVAATEASKRKSLGTALVAPSAEKSAPFALSSDGQLTKILSGMGVNYGGGAQLPPEAKAPAIVAKPAPTSRTIVKAAPKSTAPTVGAALVSGGGNVWNPVSGGSASGYSYQTANGTTTYSTPSGKSYTVSAPSYAQQLNAQAGANYW